MIKRIRIATRKSELAQWQANWVASLLRERGATVEMVYVTTHGDVHQSGPVESIGTQGVFTREVQRAVLDNEADLAVHSLKDLPTVQAEGLILTAVPVRAPVFDCLVSNRFEALDEIPPAVVIGTGSLRRKAQLLAYAASKYSEKPVENDIENDTEDYWDVRSLRGNLQTRLNKLDGSEHPYEAIILAEAGLRRLGLQDRIAQIIPPEVIMPAVGQGALGLEVRADDEDLISDLESINDMSTFLAVRAERSFLAALQGGCLAPVGVYSRWNRENMSTSCTLTMTGRVIRCNGRKTIQAQEFQLFENYSQQLASELGIRLAERLLTQGAAELIQEARGVEEARSATP